MLLVRNAANTRSLKLWQRRSVLWMLFFVFLGTFMMHSVSNPASTTASSTISHPSHSHTVSEHPHNSLTVNHHTVEQTASTNLNHSRYCSASSCYPNDAPIKLMQLMSCVAALVALALALLIPILKKLRAELRVSERVKGSALAYRILQNSTPSLISLSISRT